MIADYSFVADLSDPGTAGGHSCHFYDTANDLAQCVVPFLQAGLMRGDRCLWVVAPPLGAEAAHSVLAQALPDLDARMGAGQLEIIGAQEWYGGDAVDPDRVIRGWLRREAEALAAGYSGLCITGNTFWLETPKDFSSFSDYEERLHQALKGRRITCLCSYCLPRCSGATVLDVVRNHDFAMVRRNGDMEIIESATSTRLAEELASKNTLLNEIHHRVKNNLQIVSSLLMLKSPAFTEPAARQAVDDTLNRIHAMGLIHGMLYREDSGHEAIDFAEYVRALAEHLVFAYGVSERVAVQMKDVSCPGEAMVPLDMAVPLGIAVAEAITNAIKHAFPDNRSGLISVFMGRDGEDLLLSISDDGRGMAASDPSRHGTAAGLSLIRGLVAQAGGRMEFGHASKGGTQMHFRMKLSV